MRRRGREKNREYVLFVLVFVFVFVFFRVFFAYQCLLGVSCVFAVARRKVIILV